MSYRGLCPLDRYQGSALDLQGVYNGPFNPGRECAQYNFWPEKRNDE
jgi:hypothetical protein